MTHLYVLLWYHQKKEHPRNWVLFLRAKEGGVVADVKELAEIDYLAGMKYKDIAAKYNVSLNTVKSWQKRYGWSRKKGAPKKAKRVHPKRASSNSNMQREEADIEELVENSELTGGQRLFCVYYLRSFNATKAYRKRMVAHTKRQWQQGQEC